MESKEKKESKSSCEELTHHYERCWSPRKFHVGDDVVGCEGLCASHASVWVPQFVQIIRDLVLGKNKLLDPVTDSFLKITSIKLDLGYPHGSNFWEVSREGVQVIKHNDPSAPYYGHRVDSSLDDLIKDLKSYKEDRIIISIVTSENAPSAYSHELLLIQPSIKEASPFLGDWKYNERGWYTTLDMEPSEAIDSKESNLQWLLTTLRRDNLIQSDKLWRSSKKDKLVVTADDRKVELPYRDLVDDSAWFDDLDLWQHGKPVHSLKRKLVDAKMVPDLHRNLWIKLSNGDVFPLNQLTIGLLSLPTASLLVEPAEYPRNVELWNIYEKQATLSPADDRWMNVRSHDYGRDENYYLNQSRLQAKLNKMLSAIKM